MTMMRQSTAAKGAWLPGAYSIAEATKAQTQTAQSAAPTSTISTLEDTVARPTEHATPTEPTENAAPTEHAAPTKLTLLGQTIAKLTREKAGLAASGNRTDET